MLGPKPSTEWFVSERGVVTGPFPAQRIEDLIRWGKVSEVALLCDEYASAWLPIGRTGFAAAFAERVAESGVRRAVEPSSRGVESAGSPLALVAFALVLLVFVAAFSA